MNAPNIEYPLVSVLIPCRNEQVFIETTLDGLGTQIYPAPHFEILLLDGLSDDRTVAIAEEWQSRHPDIALSIHSNPKQTAAAALNLGIAEAKGSILARVDGHCEVGPQHLAAAVDALQSGNADCVGGPITTVGKGVIGRAIAAAMSSRFGVGGSSFRTSDQWAYVDTVPFPAWTRETLHKVGLFDESLVRNQDDEHNSRMRKAGMRILLLPEMATVYHSRPTLQGAWSQYFQYGYWKVKVMQKHLQQARLRHFIPAVWLAALVATLGVTSWSWIPLAILVGAYAITTLAATVSHPSLDPKARLLLPLAYWTLHTSYGLGTWAGIWKFLVKIPFSHAAS